MCQSNIPVCGFSLAEHDVMMFIVMVMSDKSGIVLV